MFPLIVKLQKVKTKEEHFQNLPLEAKKDVIVFIEL